MSDTVMSNEQIAAQLYDSGVITTPYSLCKQINELTGSSLKPQYFYQLVRLRYLDVTESTCESCGSTAKKVTRNSAIKYIIKALEKHNS